MADRPSMVVTLRAPTLPAGVTVLPAILKTETVPSARFATSARSPLRLIDRPALLAPSIQAADLPSCRADPVDCETVHKLMCGPSVASQ